MISLGTSMSELDYNTKEIINDLFRETDGENTNQEEIDDILEILTPELFTQAGHAMKSYAEYEQVKLEPHRIRATGQVGHHILAVYVVNPGLLMLGHPGVQEPL